MKSQIKSWVFLILLSIIWGSSFLLIKIALMDDAGNLRLSPEILAALRLSLAFIFLLPLAIIHFKKVKLKDTPYLLISGFLGNGIPAFLFAFAELQLSSAVTGMLNSLVPVFTIIIAVLFFKFIWKIKHVFGIITGIIGTFLIIGIDISQSFSLLPTTPLIMVLSGSLCYAISLNVIKYKLNHLHPNLITSISFCFIGIPSLLFLWSKDFFSEISNGEIEKEGLVAVFILALLGTTVAVLIFNRLIKISSPVFASSITYLIPVVAVVFGSLYGEKTTFIQLVGLFILLFGIVIINIDKPFHRIKQVFIFDK